MSHWKKCLIEYDIERLRRYLGYRTQNAVSRALGMGHHTVWGRLIKGATRGLVYDIIEALGGEFMDGDYFRCNGVVGKVSDFVVGGNKMS